jgi:hypothetical protein
MGIKKRLQNFWNKHLFPFELLYFVAAIFILLMYFDIYKRTVKTHARKFNELVKKTYQRINKKDDS